MQRRAVQLTVLAIVLVVATALRVYQLKDLPAGLFCDEAAEGYNAWAIGATGYDENGKLLPLFIWSFGGYKNPLYIYTAAAITRVAGLDEFTTRLPAALFGIGSIVAIFLLGRALFNPWVGLFAAIFMTVAPWHLHFSRIAFDMTLFGLLFTSGVALLVRFTQGRRTLVPAVFFCALCVYAYAIATVFVPVFLIGFGLLFLPTLLRRWRETLLAVIVAAATVAPAGLFYMKNRQGAIYLQRTTMIDPNQPWQPQVDRYLRNYAEFFSRSFLFEHGDPITRHAVRGHGELLPVFAPFLILGAAVTFLRRDRASKLVLWWLALYPAGASLMTEIPTATRAFIGAPAFCLLAGIGLGAALRALGWIARWRPLALTVQAAALGTTGYFLVPQFKAYLHTYFVEYPKYSAPTYGGFQYGYRDSIHYMEPLRSQYDLFMITATDVNQPQIFPLFYNRIDPREWSTKHDLGYLISDPAYYADYNINQRILYQLHPPDLSFFNDYTVKQRIVAPGGQEEFIIAEVRTRKNFLSRWLGLGLFENENSDGVKKDFIDVRKISKDRYKGAFTDIYWRPIPQRNVRVDLNGFFANADPKHPGNPELVCAYALTTVRSPAAQHVLLELAGSGDMGQVWLNGQNLTPWALTVGAAPSRKEINLRAGDNLLVIKSCESIGDWFFTARITDSEGHDIPDITVHQEFPTTEIPAPPVAPEADLQLVEGLDSIVSFKHTQTPYPDHRGGTESWWAYVQDQDGEVVWRTAPVPAKKRTVAVLTVSTSPDPFEAELYVNGKYSLAISFNNDHGTKTSTRGGYRMTYVFKNEAGGNSGMALIEVPPDQVTIGQPIELRVVPVKGDPHGWFMVKSYRDTIAHEGVTAEQAGALIRGDWQTSAGQ